MTFPQGPEIALKRLHKCDVHHRPPWLEPLPHGHDPRSHHGSSADAADGSAFSCGAKCAGSNRARHRLGDSTRWGSETVCKEFGSLPIEYVVRKQLLKPLEHMELLFQEAADLSGQFTGLLHDDDWWAPTHLANGVAQLQENPDALAYWAASFMVYDERSWVYQCWNVSSWIAAEYPLLGSVVRMNRKAAALACITSGPAAYSSLSRTKK